MLQTHLLAYLYVRTKRQSLVAQTLAVASKQTVKDIFAFIHSLDSCLQLLVLAQHHQPAC